MPRPVADHAGRDRGVVTKVQLRLRVHPPRHPATRDVVDQVVSAYDDLLDEILGEVEAVVRQADPRRTTDQPLVLSVSGGDVIKAGERQPFQPGSRGGKWYRDAQGHVRYGEPPAGRFMGNAGMDQPTPHLDHLRPGSFMGSSGRDQDLTGFLLEHGEDHGFSERQIQFLGAWYGNGVDGGELFDAFLECAGLTRADLKDGVANLRFGSQKLTYEEAVFEFFAAQGSLFMGEDPTAPDQAKEWNHVLNEEIKPLLDGIFIRYEEAKEDEDLQLQVTTDPARQRRRFYDAARRCEDDTLAIADSIVGDWNPERMAATAMAGLRDLGLFFSHARTERHARVHGRPHLRDAVMLDGRLLGDGPDNPLLGGGKLVSLSPSQLMLLHAAAELHRRWDQHTRSFSAEKQAEVGEGDLGEAALAALAGKSRQWSEADDAVRGRLHELVDRLVVKLNDINSREGLPDKHGSKKRPRR